MYLNLEPTSTGDAVMMKQTLGRGASRLKETQGSECVNLDGISVCKPKAIKYTFLRSGLAFQGGLIL